jgi:hypothetical protein
MIASLEQIDGLSQKASQQTFVLRASSAKRPSAHIRQGMVLRRTHLVIQIGGVPVRHVVVGKSDSIAPLLGPTHGLGIGVQNEKLGRRTEKFKSCCQFAKLRRIEKAKSGRQDLNRTAQLPASEILRRRKSTCGRFARVGPTHRRVFKRVPAQCYPFSVEFGATRPDPRNSNGHKVLLVITSRPIRAREYPSTASSR